MGLANLCRPTRKKKPLPQYIYNSFIVPNQQYKSDENLNFRRHTFESNITTFLMVKEDYKLSANTPNKFELQFHIAGDGGDGDAVVMP